VSEGPAAILARAGMRPANVRLAEGAFAAAGDGWAGLTGRLADPRSLFVPGRIEVLGKHTDYAGGATLTCAVERGVCAVYSGRRDAVVRLVDTVDARTIEFPIAADLVIPVGDWSNYPMTVARRLARNFEPPLAGVDFAFRNTLPVSAGMSSSSALITAVFLALAEVNRLQDRPLYREHIHDMADLAGYLGSVENGQPFGGLSGDHGVGTFGGSEDHTAILCSEPGRIGHFQFCPGRRLATLPLPDGYTFAIASSGVVAQKTGNARDRYNRASLLVGEILRLWRDTTGERQTTLNDAVHSGPDARERLETIVRDARSELFSAADLSRRLAHFLLENETLVPAAARALADGDVLEFGRIADESQRGASELLTNQVPETVALTRLARELGAAAASAFGAGFGGSVWALVHERDAPTFPQRWRTRYQAVVSSRVIARSTFFLTAPGRPATAV
jgi:galactokinase